MAYLNLNMVNKYTNIIMYLLPELVHIFDAAAVIKRCSNRVPDEFAFCRWCGRI